MQLIITPFPTHGTHTLPSTSVSNPCTPPLIFPQPLPNPPSPNLKALPPFQHTPTLPLILPQSSQIIQLLPRLSRNIRTIIPRIRALEQAILIELDDLLFPFLFGFVSGVDVGKVFSRKFSDGGDDPGGLEFDGGGTVGEGRGTCAGEEELG